MSNIDFTINRNFSKFCGSQPLRSQSRNYFSLYLSSHKSLILCIFLKLATFHCEQCYGGLVSHPGRRGGSWAGNSSQQFTVLKPRKALAVCRASMACFNPLSTSIHIQILQNDLNTFLNPISPKSDQHQISPCSITSL